MPHTPCTRWHILTLVNIVLALMAHRHRDAVCLYAKLAGRNDLQLRARSGAGLGLDQGYVRSALVLDKA